MGEGFVKPPNQVRETMTKQLPGQRTEDVGCSWAARRQRNATEAGR